jgi:tRNA dimethylallyltransferase
MRAGGRCRAFIRQGTRIGFAAAEAPAGIVFSLEPADRAWLHERIARRFDAMLANGFLDEMRNAPGPRRPAIRHAGDALRRISPGVGIPGRTPARPIDIRRPALADQHIARTRHRRHSAARQAADHMAAQHAGPARHCRRGPDATAQLVDAAMGIE